jgi:hypothetical protein
MLTDFLKAIWLSGVGPEHFGPDLADAIHRARFADLSRADAVDLERIGKAILSVDDIDSLPSGYFDRNGVLLPVDTLLGDSEAIANRLEWMLFLPRDAKISALVLKALNHPLKSLPTRGAAGPLIDPRAGFTLEWLSTFLSAGSSNSAGLVTALLNGQLGDAQILLADEPRQTEWRYAVRCMRIVWSIFDLQIMTYRLHKAEMHSFENSVPALTTLSALQHLIKEMFQMAELAKAAYFGGRDGSHLNPRLRRFIDQIELEVLAIDNLERLIVAGKAPNAARDPRTRYRRDGANDLFLSDLGNYLDYLHRIMARAVGPLLAMRDESALSLPDWCREVSVRAPREKRVKRRPGKARLELKQEATVTRFGVTTLVAYACAVQSSVAAIGGIPVAVGSRKPREGVLIGPRGRHQLERELFLIYRVFILRDARHADVAAQDPLIAERFARTKPADTSTSVHAIAFARDVDAALWLELATGNVDKTSRLSQRSGDDAKMLRQNMGWIPSPKLDWVRRKFEPVRE